MADGTDNLRKEIVILPPSEKIAIAREVVRSLDPDIREDFVSEFESSPENSEARRQHLVRVTLIGVGTLVIVLCIFALLMTMSQAPEHLDKVGGVITTLVSGALGFIGGRATAGQESAN